jgi:superfamily II DNA/RNA helicase
VGVTATPNRNDGLGLSKFYDEIGVNFDLRYGIEEGYLCDIQAYQVDTGADISGVRVQAGEFVASQIEEATDNEERNNVVVNAYMRYSRGQALAFCGGVQHAHHLAATFAAAGIKARAVDGGTPKHQREEIIQQFSDGEIQVLTNCAVLTEGFDAPRCDTILMVRPIRSTPLYIQCLGRGTRTFPPSIGNHPTKAERLEAIRESEKPAMKLIDFCDIAGSHNIVTLPSLFGMSSALRDDNDDQGTFVQEKVRRMEELIEENPHKEQQIREAGSFEEMEVEAKQISVWDVARVSNDVQRMSDLSWMRMGPDTYQLEVPAERRFHVRLERDLLDNWQVKVHYPRQHVEGAGMMDAETRVGREFDSLEDAISSVDEKIRSAHKRQWSLMQHSPSWGSGKPSSGQIKFLDRLKVNYPVDDKGKPTITKGEASRLISAAKAMQESKRRRKQREKQQKGRTSKPAFPVQ